MKNKAWLILGLFLVWGAGSTYWYVCKIKGFCSTEQEKITRSTTKEKEISPVVEKKITDMIYFDKEKIVPVINDTIKWSAEIKSLKQLQSEGKKLFIYGPYFKDEVNTSKFENLGIARAEQLKKILSRNIDTGFMITRSKLLDGNLSNRISDFKNWFKWKEYNDYVKEEDNSILLYFPYNSTKEIKNKEIIRYLEELATKLKNNNNLKVDLIGHTDNTGNNASNIILSKRRADRIRKILIKKGVKSNQLNTIGKGESEPVASNDTKEGRQKNRRVEIIIKK